MLLQNILVAIDGSETGKDVYAEALALAKLTNANLMLLYVLSPLEEDYPIFPADTRLGGYFPQQSDELNQIYLKQLEQYAQEGVELLKPLAAQANAEGVNAEFTQNAGNPGRNICNLARTWKADLIVMGRRGHSGLSELVLGSVSNYVLHHAPCSVLVVQGQSRSTS